MFITYNRTSVNLNFVESFKIYRESIWFSMASGKAVTFFFSDDEGNNFDEAEYNRITDILKNL